VGLSSRKYNLIQENVKDIAKHLKETILKSGKRIRIFPLRATNNYGYKGYTKRNDHLPTRGYFDIDLRDDNSQAYKDSKKILEHIANVMHAYPDAFVVAEYDSEWNDGSMIFAFNLNGYIHPDEIYSLAGSSGRVFSVNTISQVFEDPNSPGNKIEFYDLVGEYNIKWNNLWSHHIGYSLSAGGVGEWHNIYFTNLQRESPEISDLLFIDHQEDKT
jgi:hypothetical protein